MDRFSAETQPGVESQLIDLGAVTMTALREVDDPVLRKALRDVLQQTANPRVSRGSSERVD